MLARKIERGERLPWQWEEALAEMRDHRLDVQDARKELARRAAGGKPLPYLPLSEIWGDVLPDDPFPEGARPLRSRRIWRRCWPSRGELGHTTANQGVAGFSAYP